MERDGYLYRENKLLRRGYTTGSCAAAATKAAAQLLLVGTVPREVRLLTPKGVTLTLAVEEPSVGEGWASCGIRKDSGDDPDSTNGVLVVSRVERTAAPGITVDGGVGVGRVTRPGLACPVGEAAINPVPRQMIAAAAGEVLDACDLGEQGLRVTVSIPEGEVLAARTYNPRLGIVGGLSVLGTTGILEPMSEQALVDSIRAELQVLRSEGVKHLLVTPGNYGQSFVTTKLNLPFSQAVLCSNFVGDTLDMAVELGFAGVLLVGHMGKFVKLAAGIMNTHSRYADGRMEVLAAHAGMAGASPALLADIMNAITTDQAMELLIGAGLDRPVLRSVVERIDSHLSQRVYGRIPVGAMLFTNPLGLLGETQGAAALAKAIEHEHQRRSR